MSATMTLRRQPDFGDFLDFLIIATLATGALVAAGRLARSDDRFTIEREPVSIEPARKIEPVAIPESQIPPPIKRPSIYVYSSDNCEPCKAFERDAEAGAFPRLTFEHRVPPAWVNSVPTFHFAGEDNQWYSRSGYLTAAGLIHAYSLVNPRFSQEPDLPAPATVEKPTAQVPSGAGSTIAEQFQKFAGTSGTFEIKPERPIAATLDDGTAVSYIVIRGRYSIVDGRPKLTLSDPMPTIVATKFFMRFGVTLQDAIYDPPSSVSIGTSRGRYRIELKGAK